MNVLIAADYCASQSGNFIASVIALARKLREEKNQVVFVFPEQRDWQEWIKREGFEVLCTGKESLLAEKQFGILKGIIEKYKIDLVHSHFGMFYHTIVFDRNKMKNVKILIHDHMGFAVELGMERQLLDLMVRSIMYSFKHIRVISVMKKKE